MKKLWGFSYRCMLMPSSNKIESGRTESIVLRVMFPLAAMFVSISRELHDNLLESEHSNHKDLMVARIDLLRRFFEACNQYMPLYMGYLQERKDNPNQFELIDKILLENEQEPLDVLLTQPLHHVSLYKLLVQSILDSQQTVLDELLEKKELVSRELHRLSMKTSFDARDSVKIDTLNKTRPSDDAISDALETSALLNRTVTEMMTLGEQVDAHLRANEELLQSVGKSHLPSQMTLHSPLVRRNLSLVVEVIVLSLLKRRKWHLVSFHF